MFNVIDKFVAGEHFLWVGKDRLSQFVEYFSSIGITDPGLAARVLLLVSIIEVIALLFFTLALLFVVINKKLVRGAVFYGILTSLVLFSLFSIGDQVFGDRHELLEHTIYWIALVLSWFIYTRIEKK